MVSIGADRRNGVGPNPLDLTDLVLQLSPFRHSGESRNPGFSGFLDPGFRRGDAVEKGNILKLTALGRAPTTNLNGHKLLLIWPFEIGLY
jgi:hypothetical protein